MSMILVYHLWFGILVWASSDCTLWWPRYERCIMISKVDSNFMKSYELRACLWVDLIALKSKKTLIIVNHYTFALNYKSFFLSHWLIHCTYNQVDRLVTLLHSVAKHLGMSIDWPISLRIMDLCIFHEYIDPTHLCLTSS